MTRPTRIRIDEAAITHNVQRVRQCAPGKKIIAMVKANAYGCGIENVVPVLDGNVDCFGVACIEEAMAIRQLGIRTSCMLAQGVFDVEELKLAAAQGFQCVIHHRVQLEWLLATPLISPIKVWVKVNTGMHRLGLPMEEIEDIVRCLQACPWVNPEIGLMTHLANADVLDHEHNQLQLTRFTQQLPPLVNSLSRSMANSAALLTCPHMHLDVVRPGIMLYGVSPFATQIGSDHGLLPVMRFQSAIGSIYHYPAFSPIGYGGTWQSDKPAVIGVIPVGYGDGYPRRIAANTPIWVNGCTTVIVGRVSMDMITVDLTHCPGINIGDPVELWGQHIPVEVVARSAGTIGYELLCQVTKRAFALSITA